LEKRGRGWKGRFLGGMGWNHIRAFLRHDRANLRRLS
jgi:hypothetical protein